MMSKKMVQCCLAAWLGLLANGALAASAGNHYVTVSSDTAGVEAIVPVDDDFYVTTRGVGAPDFIADISVSPNFSWRLVYPSSGKLELGIGASDLYEVEDSTGSEDSAGGRIEVLKLDIAPSETNICWKSSGVTLSLTSDSALGGGTATWSSEPTGIDGSGTSIAVNPGSLAPGEYVVTAASTIVPSYADTCVVRIIKVDVTNSVVGLRENSFTSPEYLGMGTGDEFASRYFAAVMALRDPVQKATNLWNDMELGPIAMAELHQAVTNFEASCRALAEEATIAEGRLALVPPECQPIAGSNQFTVCASPRTANVAIDVKGVDGWNSTASFGEHLWTSINPASFFVGTQVVTIEPSGNLGVLSVDVHIGHPCNEVVRLNYSVTGITEEDCVVVVLRRFNANKARIESQKQIVDDAEDVRSILEGWVGLIPVAGAAISASINTVGTVTKNLVLRYYNAEMRVNLDNTKAGLVEIEELAERTPAGGAESHDRVEQAEMLEAGN